jgi:opacity protein-like surface antigen
MSKLRVAAAIVVLASPCAQAGDWQQEIAPYLFAAGMDGTAGIGPVEADVSQSFGDILSNLDMGFMGAYRATKDRYSITVDTIYMSLGASQKGPGGLLEGDVGVDQLALEADFGYALNDTWTLLAGLRYNDISSDVKVAGPVGVNKASGSEAWVDPLVGAIFGHSFNDTWSMTLRGDVGGFGVGSDLTWQGLATVRWQVTPTVGVLGAYRYIDMDYDSGKRSKRFLYDMAITGPAVGVVFSF